MDGGWVGGFRGLAGEDGYVEGVGEDEGVEDGGPESAVCAD